MGEILNKIKNIETVDISYDNPDRLEFLRLDKLKVSGSRVRRKINREAINRMAENIKNFGILQPLEVNERNEIILGIRRFEAAKLASLDKIPVIRRKSSNMRELEKQVVSDIHSKKISLLERARAFQKLIELKNISKYGLAKYLSLSHNLVCRTLAILDANPKTKELIENEKISERMAAVVLYRLKDRSKEDHVFRKIINERLSISQAENLITEINDSSILKKHFLKQLKSFKTSLVKFKDKAEMSGLDENEIKKELEELKQLIK